MIRESYIKFSDFRLHLATLDRGCKNELPAKYPVEVFYILEGKGGLNIKGRSFQNLNEGDLFEIYEGDKAEIVGYSTLDFFHIALPSRLKDKNTLKNLGRQITALQYCTKNNLSHISAMNETVMQNIIDDGITVNAENCFGLSDPEYVQKDSELLFKTILKNYLNYQRNNYDCT